MRTEQYQKIELYRNMAIEEGLDSDKGSLQFQMDFFFGGIDFTNKRILDIGGGSGLYSFWAACSGATEVVCIEPEDAGSSPGILQIFQKLNARLKCDNVVLETTTFQNFDPKGKAFDIIVLCNSINHLDEAACINLLKNAKSKNIYREIFTKIAALSSEGANLIICDCSRYNFFGLLGIRNPFVPQIQWHKHQAPEVWAHMLGDVGFVNRRIRWSSFNRFRWWGRVFIGNKFMAYFLTSHFCLTLVKQ